MQRRRPSPRVDNNLEGDKMGGPDDDGSGSTRGTSGSTADGSRPSRPRRRSTEGSEGESGPENKQGRTKRKKKNKRRPSTASSVASSVADASSSDAEGRSRKGKTKKKGRAKKLYEESGTVQDSMLVAIKNNRKQRASESAEGQAQDKPTPKRTSFSESTIRRDVEKMNKGSSSKKMHDLEIAMGKMLGPTSQRSSEDSIDDESGSSIFSLESAESNDAPGAAVGEISQQRSGFSNDDSTRSVGSAGSALRPSKYGAGKVVWGTGGRKKRTSFSADEPQWKVGIDEPVVTSPKNKRHVFQYKFGSGDDDVNDDDDFHENGDASRPRERAQPRQSLSTGADISNTARSNRSIQSEDTFNPSAITPRRGGNVKGLIAKHRMRRSSGGGSLSGSGQSIQSEGGMPRPGQWGPPGTPSVITEESGGERREPRRTRFSDPGTGAAEGPSLGCHKSVRRRRSTLGGGSTPSSRFLRRSSMHEDAPRFMSKPNRNEAGEPLQLRRRTSLLQMGKAVHNHHKKTVRRMAMSETDQTYIPPKSRGGGVLWAAAHLLRGRIVELTLWTYSASTMKVMGFFLLVYLVNILLWAVVMDAVDIASGGRCVHDEPEAMTKAMRFELSVEMSWATFTTVGYGNISPRSDMTGCYGIRFMAAFVAFVGVLYASTTAAIMYSKLMRLLARAHVTFSSTLCVQYGKGNEGSTVRYGQLNFRASVAPATALRGISAEDLLKCSDDEDDGGGGGSTEGGFPVIEFRMMNDRANHEGSEIWDATIKGVVQLHKETPSDGGDRQTNSFALGDKKAIGGESTLDLEKKVYYPVSLSPNEHPHFSRIWYARHVLDAESPLLKREVRDMIVKDGGKWDKDFNTWEEIRDCMNEFISLRITLSGTSAVSASDVYGEHVYEFDDVCIGWRFANMVYSKNKENYKGWWRRFGVGRHVNEDGSDVVNYTKTKIDEALLHDIVPQNGGDHEPLTDSQSATAMEPKSFFLNVFTLGRYGDGQRSSPGDKGGEEAESEELSDGPLPNIS